jgi:hypothetical protein
MLKVQPFVFAILKERGGGGRKIGQLRCDLILSSAKATL